ncbi:unnamed protein product [Fusarium equiseti]|uniref:BHLH domain-containing protein n=1 Tax=Fusarium equiseti TaxID=61235 RepID=A0A8J2IRV4_FUSEQ|nr:unnamed protein product [Fusarium equiseti]
MAASDITGDTSNLLWSITNSQGKKLEQTSFVSAVKSDVSQVPLDAIQDTLDQASPFVLSSPGLPETNALGTSSHSDSPSLPQWLDSIKDGYHVSVEHLSDTKDMSSLDFESTSIRETSIEPSGDGTGVTYNLDDLEKESPEVKLRSASRKPKRTRQKISVAANVQRARNCHNNIEKKYRARLKQGFERLLAVLYTSMPLVGDENFCQWGSTPCSHQFY